MTCICSLPCPIHGPCAEYVRPNSSPTVARLHSFYNDLVPDGDLGQMALEAGGLEDGGALTEQGFAVAYHLFDVEGVRVGL